jgi:predicted ATP-grasp superfamily ATP-dependent carboligase
MKTVLLTLGRFPKALALARQLHQLGWRVIVAEPFGWHLCKVSRHVAKSYRVPSPNTDQPGYLNRLLEIVNENSISLIIPVSEESYHVAHLHGLLPPGVTLLAPTPALYDALHDKSQFAQRAQALGLVIPETYPTDSPQAIDLVTKTATVIKPRGGCSGFGVCYLAQGDHRALTTFVNDKTALVQQEIKGTMVCTLSLVDRGKPLHTSAYTGDVFSGTVAICFTAIPLPEKIRIWITLFLQDTDYKGFIAFDFIVDDEDTPWPLECNPRLTSGVHFISENALATLIGESSSPHSPACPSRRLQWAYSTLTEAYGALFRGDVRRFFTTLKQLATTRDAVWALSDPLPFLLMTPLSWPILWPAITEGIGLGEASQRDIAPLWSADNP